MMEEPMSRIGLFPVVLISALALSTALAQGAGAGGGSGGGSAGTGGTGGGGSSAGGTGGTSQGGTGTTTSPGRSGVPGITTPNLGPNRLNDPRNPISPNFPSNRSIPVPIQDR